MHLLTRSQQQACLDSIYKHLQPGGLLIIDVVAPELEKLVQKPGPQYFITREFDLPNGSRVTRRIRLLEHDPVNQIRHFEFKFEESNRSGSLLREEHVPVTTRYIFRYELQLLLETAGFKLVNVFRDYDKSPYDGTEEMIVVARK